MARARPVPIAADRATADMTLANPAALSLLLAIPALLWLERASRQRQTLVVPSLLLFRRLPAPTLEAARERQQHRQWLVWLECLGLALAALGAAAPQRTSPPSPASSPRWLEVVVDRSASMGRQLASGDTLLDVATQRLAPWIEEHAHEATHLLLVSEPPAPGQSSNTFELDRGPGDATWLDLVTSLRPVSRPDALQSYASPLEPQERVAHLVISDRSPHAPQPAPPNLGISAVLHRAQGRGDQLFVRIANGGNQHRRARLLLHTTSPDEFDTALHRPPRTSLELEIAPRSERAAVLSDAALGSTLVASVSVVSADGAADTLDADDQVVCTRLPRRHLTAIIAGRPAPAVRRALDAAARGLGHVLVVEERPHWPANDQEVPSADLVVLNEIEPLVYPRAPVVVAIRGLASASLSGPVTGTRAVASDLFPGLDLSGIRVAKTRHDPPPNLTPLLSSTPDDLVMVGRRPASQGAGSFVYVGFPVEDPVVTDWPLDASFPLLFAACVEIAAEGQTGELKAWPTGTPLAEMVQASLVEQAPNDLVVRFPKGEDPSPRRLDTPDLPASRPGLYRFEDSQGRLLGLGGAGLLSSHESVPPTAMLKDPPVLAHDGNKVAPTPPPEHSPMGALILCLAAGLLAATTVSRLQNRPGVASAKEPVTSRPQ